MGNYCKGSHSRPYAASVFFFLFQELEASVYLNVIINHSDSGSLTFGSSPLSPICSDIDSVSTFDA